MSAVVAVVVVVETGASRDRGTAAMDEGTGIGAGRGGSSSIGATGSGCGGDSMAAMIASASFPASSLSSDLTTSISRVTSSPGI